MTPYNNIHRGVLETALNQNEFRGSVADAVRSVMADANRLDRERRLIQNDSRVVTCVFCGHQYPPGTPASNHEALKAHVAVCPKHPAAEFRKRAEQAEARVVEAERDMRAQLAHACEWKNKAAVAEMAKQQAEADRDLARADAEKMYMALVQIKTEIRMWPEYRLSADEMLAIVNDAITSHPGQPLIEELTRLREIVSAMQASKAAEVKP